MLFTLAVLTFRRGHWILGICGIVLPFLLLSDHSHRVARLYESYNEESGFNIRTVYVIDKRGTIAYIDPAYKAGSPESFAKLKDALSTLH